MLSVEDKIRVFNEVSIWERGTQDSRLDISVQVSSEAWENISKIDVFFKNLSHSRQTPLKFPWLLI